MSEAPAAEKAQNRRTLVLDARGRFLARLLDLLCSR